MPTTKKTGGSSDNGWASADLSLAERLTTARARNRKKTKGGIMPIWEARDRAVALAPGWIRQSREYIRRLEAGTVSHNTVDPLFLLALANVYNQTPEWLLGEYAEDMKKVHDLFPHDLCVLRVRQKAWTDETAGQTVCLQAVS